MSLRRAPKIGDRVTYTPPANCHRKTPCTGTVRAIYREYECEDERCTGRLLPEREWSVCVEVDAPLPSWWDYVGTNRFAPQVKELSMAEGMTTPNGRRPDNGGAAFPVADQGTHGCYGMTLRDYFAAKAMAAFLVGADGWINDVLAAEAYAVADAMLAAREEES